MSETTETLADVVARLSLSISAEFVPFSRSRNAKANPKVGDLSLNWKVTLRHNGRDVLTTDYMAGIAHCPAYAKAQSGGGYSVAGAEAIHFECERGRPVSGTGAGIYGKPIEPNPVDVIYSLAMDAGALDFATFEDWAADYGYDTDSRKGETIYRQCLSHALALRNAIGDQALTELRNAACEH